MFMLLFAANPSVETEIFISLQEAWVYIEVS